MSALLNDEGAPVHMRCNVKYLVPDDAAITDLACDIETWTDNAAQLLWTAVEVKNATPETLRHTMYAAAQLIGLANRAAAAVEIIALRSK